MPFKSLHGTISNSNLEQAGHLAHNNVLASFADIDSATVPIYTNNTLVLSWTKYSCTFNSILGVCLSVYRQYISAYISWKYYGDSKWNGRHL